MRALPTRLAPVAALLLCMLGSTSCRAPEPTVDDPAPPQPLRVLAYNIKRGFGNDGVTDIGRAAEVIRKLQPDLVALQEIDIGVERSGRVDQIAQLAAKTGMQGYFGKFMDYQGGEYGIGLLSRLPVTSSAVHPLPEGSEPRVALAVDVELPNGGPLTFCSVHLYNTEAQRLAQAEALIEFYRDHQHPVIVAGDFNSEPGGVVMKALGGRGRWHNPDKGTDRFTFSATDPYQEIDAVLLRPAGRFEVTHIDVLDEPVVSDHRPLLLDVSVRAAQSTAPGGDSAPSPAAAASAGLPQAGLPQDPEADAPRPAGPLLYVTTAEGSLDDRVERVLEIQSPGSNPAGKEPRTRMLCEGRRAFRVERRLDDSTLLVKPIDGPLARLNLTTLALSPLLPIELKGNVQFVDLFDGAAIAIRRPRGSFTGDLLHFVPGSKEPAVLHADDVQDVLAVRREGIVYTVRADPMQVWTALFKPGTVRHVATLPAHATGEAALFTTFALSPSSRRLATGMVDPAGGFMIQVTDLITGKEINLLDGIPVHISPLSSALPKLKMCWVDDETVRFSESEGTRMEGTMRWVDWNVDSGKRTLEHTYGTMALEHAQPDPQSLAHPGELPFRRGAFVWTAKELILKGETEPIFRAGTNRNGSTGTIKVAPDGRWAVAQRIGEDPFYLIDSKGKLTAAGRGWVIGAVFL